MEKYFADKQDSIRRYKKNLESNNVTIDKTNLMFLNLILNYLGNENPEKLDELFEYNILTMRKEFDGVVDKNIINEKAQAVLLTFFLRMAKELEVKYSNIENEDMNKLFTIMTAKGYKYPDYIRSQKNFTLDKMPENIKRFLHFK